MVILSGFWMFQEYSRVVYEEKNITAYTQRANYTYSAPVTEPNPLYPEGTQLGMGKPAYFFSVSPTADISFVYSLEAAESADISVEANTVILASCKGGYGEEQKIFWQKGFPLGDSKTAQLKSGEVLTSNFTLDVPQIEVKAGETTIIPEIVLKENSMELKEVVITTFKSNNEKSVIIGASTNNLRLARIIYDR